LYVHFILFFLSHFAFVALVITAEHSFWTIQHAAYSGLKQAAKIYIKSSTAKSVSHQIQTVFQARSSEIPAFTQNNLYETQIASPLSDIICNNLLRVSISIFYYARFFLYLFLAH